MVAGGELVQLVRIGQHARPIKGKHRVQRTRQRVDRQRRGRFLTQRARTQQRVQIGAMVWMAVADKDHIDLLGCGVAQQPRQRCIARVHKQPETVVLHKETAAGTASLRPCTAGPQHPQPHQNNPTDAPATNRLTDRPHMRRVARIR